MSLIYEAFATSVSIFAAQFSPPLPVSFPGIGFTPPTSGTWLEVQWFPNQTVNYGIEDEGPSLQQGFGQVSVCYRPGLGIVAGGTVANQLIGHFAKGTELAFALVYRTPWESGPIQAPERVAHPVTVMWRGFGSDVPYALFFYGGSATSTYEGAVPISGGGA